MFEDLKPNLPFQTAVLFHLQIEVLKGKLCKDRIYLKMPAFCVFQESHYLQASDLKGLSRGKT